MVKVKPSKVRFRRHRADVEERGAAIIEAVLVIPLLALMLAGVMDVSQMFMSYNQTDYMATAAVRYCMDNPDTADEAHVSEYLGEIAPSFAERCTVEVEQGSQVADPSYVYRVYQDEDYIPATRTSTYAHAPVRVTVDYKGTWLTGLMRALSASDANPEGALLLSSTRAGELDQMDATTW